MELSGDIFDEPVVLRGEGRPTGTLGERVIASLIPGSAPFRHSEKCKLVVKIIPAGVGIEAANSAPSLKFSNPTRY